ncbi:RNA-binding protein [Embleya sp. NPDC127516]|uniref:RNA-binding protein n=1 Tax=Embleya sp. NPDC127516 TaxID=3363990 RepID=UPI0037F7A861
MLPYVYRVTEYIDHDEHGGPDSGESINNSGLVEAACLQAIAAFAEDADVQCLNIREPQIEFFHFGSGPSTDGHGLAGLFPPDLAGFHDGARVPVAVGLELVRAMLRDSGVWCRLEAEGEFAVHVGDAGVYVCSIVPCIEALARARALGLSPARADYSPYDASFDDEPGVQEPADEDFWARLRSYLAAPRAALLEENYLYNASRWHRITADNLDTVRAGLTPPAPGWPSGRT